MRSSLRPIGILVAATVAVFANSLFNGFVGDDWVILIENTFYHSLDNIGYLFTDQYLTPSTYSQAAGNFHSGSVAYRPVVSLTFFVDYAIWKLNPFGFHLSNLIWHAVNAALVYSLVHRLAKSTAAALLAALLFSVHPVRTEAVCAIGYRADILSTFFVLVSVLSYLQADSLPHKRKVLGLVSATAYFLALFAKESAIILPALLVGYDVYFKNAQWKDIGAGLKGRYAGYLLVAAFYLYIYLKVFMNTTLGNIGWPGGDILAGLAISLWIFAQYVMMLALPFVVHILPPLYAPSLISGAVVKLMVSAGLLACVVIGTVRTFRTHKDISFFLLWFLIGVIPVVNLIPIANPMAHRFLYLPSVGFFAAAAIAFDLFTARWKNSSQMPHLPLILKALILGLCVVTTLPLNMRWKSDLSVARSLLENYPDNPKAYSILGMDHLRKHRFKEAADSFERYLSYGAPDPAVHFLTGVSLMNVNELEGAKAHLGQAISLFPHAAVYHNALGKIYFIEKQDALAQRSFETSLSISANDRAYGYLAQLFFRQGRAEQAQAVLEQAEKALGQDRASVLRELIQKNDPALFPIDIGL